MIEEYMKVAPHDEKIKLSKGAHTFALIYESDVDNMDLYVNDFKVNKFRLTRLKN